MDSKINEVEEEKPIVFAQKAAFLLYDLIAQFEDELDDEFVEEVEDVIQQINSL